jgi:hypothetical protein
LTEEIAVVLKTIGVSTGTWIPLCPNFGFAGIWIGDSGNVTLPQSFPSLNSPFSVLFPRSDTGSIFLTQRRDSFGFLLPIDNVSEHWDIHPNKYHQISTSAIFNYSPPKIKI